MYDEPSLVHGNERTKRGSPSIADKYRDMTVCIRSNVSILDGLMFSSTMVSGSLTSLVELVISTCNNAVSSGLRDALTA